MAVDTLFGYIHGFTIEDQAHCEHGPDDRFPAGVELILAGLRQRLPVAS